MPSVWPCYTCSLFSCLLFRCLLEDVHYSNVYLLCISTHAQACIRMVENDQKHLIFECFWLFSTMRTHVQTCIRWSKYTTSIIQLHFVNGIMTYFWRKFSLTHIKGLSKKTTCLRGLKALKPCSRKAKINFGFMSMLVYNGGLRLKLFF